MTKIIKFIVCKDPSPNKLKYLIFIIVFANNTHAVEAFACVSLDTNRNTEFHGLSPSNPRVQGQSIPVLFF